MAAVVQNYLAATNAKQRGESANFEAFRLANPSFAGRPLVSIRWGGDPPDVLCLDAEGKRVGVELVQWVNGQQMAESKERFKLEDSYRIVIRSSYERPPKNIGLIFIDPKTLLTPQQAATFRSELYGLVGRLDNEWPSHPEWDDPQGYLFTDFSGYPCLVRHLEGLDVYARSRRFAPGFGAEWITFRAHGGAYTPDWMRDALLNNIRRKVVKYAKRENELKLQQQQLNEFCLLAYYDEAVLHNTPYGAPGFGFSEIGAWLTRDLAVNPHPFDRVFLYSPLERPPYIQVWPAR
ncbi:MAG TPA: hypothetical protein VJO53_12525 [Candidatus Acidoferrales bacterium]|nr:hypothetical protein [Candidatus Acidoferrales bacterium]